MQASDSLDMENTYSRQYAHKVSINLTVNLLKFLEFLFQFVRYK